MQQLLTKATIKYTFTTPTDTLSIGHSLQNSKTPQFNSMEDSHLNFHQGANMTLYDEFDQFQCLACAEGRLLLII